MYSKESIPPAYVAWRAGTTTLFLLGSWPPYIVLKFSHSIFYALVAGSQGLEIVLMGNS
jgi:hypothetical protein